MNGRHDVRITSYNIPIHEAEVIIHKRNSQFLRRVSVFS